MANFKPIRAAAASRGFLAAVRLSCITDCSLEANSSSSQHAPARWSWRHAGIKSST